MVGGRGLGGLLGGKGGSYAFFELESDARAPRALAVAGV